MEKKPKMEKDMKSINIGQCARVSMKIVEKHCNLPPYLSLVRKAIKNGGGFVQIFSLNADMAVVAGDSYDYLLGGVRVPIESLIF